MSSEHTPDHPARSPGSRSEETTTPNEAVLLARGIAAARAGDKGLARELLTETVRRYPDSVPAWLWLTGVLNSREARVHCLQRVLALQPDNEAARRGLAALGAKPEPGKAGAYPHPSPPAPQSFGGSRLPERAREERPARATNTLVRVARYAVVRALVLALMVIVTVYVAVVVINYGGYIDQIHRADIEEALLFMSLGMRDKTPEQVAQATDAARQAMEEAMGLNRPFLLRCARWTYEALTFNWGGSRFELVPTGGPPQKTLAGQIVLVALPNTLLLAGSANLLLFVASVLLALRLSRQHGSLLDRIIVSLSPISSAPNWVYGVLLTVILAGELHLLPFGGKLDEFPPATKIGYVPIVLKHMVLPVLAIFLSQFFQTVYAWRTYFLIHSGEDYIDLARAKGLSERTIERRYVLRPGLPYVVTSLALMLVTFWQGILVLELFFNWPGIGRLFLLAVPKHDQSVQVAVIVLFALLLALSVFILDVVYALVDPRVKVGGASQALRPAIREKRRFRLWPTLTRSRDAMRQQQAGWKPAEGPASEAPPQAPVAAGGASRPRRRMPWGQAWRLRLGRVGSGLRLMARHPGAVLGATIIVGLIGVSIYTVIAIPYHQAVETWREEAAQKREIPMAAQPAWVNLFRRERLPPSIVQNSRDGSAGKTVEPGQNSTARTVITFTFDYPYSAIPQDVAVYFGVSFTVKKPFATMTWLTPDGRTFELGSFSVVSNQRYMVSEDLPQKYRTAAGVRQLGLAQGTGGTSPVEVLFAAPPGQAGAASQGSTATAASGSARRPAALKGRYTLRVDGYTFEAGSSLDAQMVVDGQVYGLAGTDNNRRDLLLALLWGTPVALAFGLVGAVATSLLSMLIAAAGAWFRGWVDGLIQRLTEVGMLVPALPLAIMVFYLYSHSVWVILGVIVLASVFGSAVKNYRAAFLQVREAPYIEAAQAYGAGHWRLIARYLVPRILPLLIPQLVILVPTYVFFEATLAFVGIGDPNLPTWGKVVAESIGGGAFQGHYYWVLEPIALMMITGLAFAMVGFALDSLLNPRLRRI